MAYPYYTGAEAAPTTQVTFRGAGPTPADRAAALSGAPKQGYDSRAQNTTARNVMLFVGVLLFLLVVIRPISDSIVLLWDPVFVFFVGRRWPFSTICICLAVLLLYMLVIVLFFRYGKDEYKTEQTVIMIATISVTTLGLGLLLISVPLRKESVEAMNELFYNCETGPRTQRLYEYSTVLQGLRADPACASLSSVSACNGFEEAQPYTGFLRDLAVQYRCSGFCWGSNSSSAAAFAAQQLATSASAASGAAPAGQAAGSGAPAAALVSAGSAGRLSLSKALRNLVQRDALIREATGTSESDNGEWRQVTLSNATIRDKEDPGSIAQYPPSLFTRANYQNSCEGAAARDLRFKAISVSDNLYWQGVVLLLGSVLVGMLRIMHLCGRTRSESEQLNYVQPKRYGSVF